MTTIARIHTGVLLALFSSGVFGCSSAEPSGDADEAVAQNSAEVCVCTPGSHRCVGTKKLQTCNAKGRWDAPTKCEKGCKNDACVPDTEPPPDPAIAGALDGQMMLSQCQQMTGEADVCLTQKPGMICPSGTPTDLPLRGILTTDKVVTLGGDPALTYTISLRVQGVVEAKSYPNSADANGTAVSPTANGFTVGGKPTVTDAYGVYMLRVSDPPQDYFLNSLVPPGVSDHTTYGVDYTAQIQAKGGSTVRIVSSDANCAQIKNCGSVHVPGQCAAPQVIIPSAHAVELNPTFPFDQPYNGQWLVMTVTAVTAN